MSKITVALEGAVVEVQANTPATGEPQTNRQRVRADRAFATILGLIAPRIRHFIRQYGLLGHREDAEQACAIGVHRAIQSYDPTRAQFTTFVNWQLRAELQALRFRLMDDQRPSAKKVSATTISLDTMLGHADGEELSLAATIVDEVALERTESAAADYMAAATRTRLIDQYVDHLREVGVEQLRRRARTRPVAAPVDPAMPRLRAALYPVDAAELAALEGRLAQQRDAIERRLSGDETVADPTVDEVERERSRQVGKRAAATIAAMASENSRFARSIAAPRRRAAARIA